jgi:hypothetical protein
MALTPALPPFAYDHHGLALGDGTVIHFSPPPSKGKREAVVRRDTIRVFSRDVGMSELPPASTEVVAPGIAILRGLTRLGQGGYFLPVSNCEHFVWKILTGKKQSLQVEREAKRIAFHLLIFAASTRVPHMSAGHVEAGWPGQPPPPRTLFNPTVHEAHGRRCPIFLGRIAQVRARWRSILPLTVGASGRSLHVDGIPWERDSNWVGVSPSDVTALERPHSARSGTLWTDTQRCLYACFRGPLWLRIPSGREMLDALLAAADARVGPA